MPWVYAWVPDSEIERVSGKVETPVEDHDPEPKEPKAASEPKNPKKPKAGCWEPNAEPSGSKGWEDDSWGAWQPHVEKSSKSVGPYAGDPNKTSDDWWKKPAAGPGWETTPALKPQSKPLPRRRMWQMEMIEDGGKVDSD